MGHKAYTTSIVFMGRVIKTVELKVFFFGCRGHGALLRVFTQIEECNSLQQQCQYF
jgi:hypothetical protein